MMVFKMMHPVLEEVKRVVGDKIRIIKVDVDKHNDTAAQYQVQAPTLMLFRGGEVLFRQSGAMSRNDLLALLDPIVGD